jgi:hypothetical protein
MNAAQTKQQLQEPWTSCRGTRAVAVACCFVITPSYGDSGANESG